MLPSSRFHVAKCTPATLGVASTRVAQFSTSYRSGSGNKLAKHSGFEKAPAGSSETSPDAIPAVGHPQKPDSAAAIDRAKRQLFASDGIPSEHAVLTALLHCHRAACIATGPSTGQIARKSAESGTAASSLLSLDGSIPNPLQPLAAEVSATSEPSDLADHISDVAFDVVTHPTVVITPQVLEAYVVIQARLGRPETLPHVLTLYASKPKPRARAGCLEYVAQDPDKAVAAVSPSIVEKALDAAIEAKNLDAAVGIIESTYATKAHVRQKLLRRALVPASLAATAPLAVYLAASSLAQYQSSFDQNTATVVAAAGMLAYVGITGSMGLLAILTQNDHMSRVTWAPGISLRKRWLREEQRAAFDKVACSFGFSQSQRFGEEEGLEFQSLREFVLRKGMVLDRVELMEGMT
ncbi:unnamed protein product [Discula destructiva]